ncbi:MAG: hypothetical protein AAF601_14715 [Pseudomonadota bacterium]
MSWAIALVLAVGAALGCALGWAQRWTVLFALVGVAGAVFFAGLVAAPQELAVLLAWLGSAMILAGLITGGLLAWFLRRWSGRA